MILHLNLGPRVHHSAYNVHVGHLPAVLGEDEGGEGDDEEGEEGEGEDGGEGGPLI